MPSKKPMRSTYKVILATPKLIVLIDCLGDVSVTNDAMNVIDDLFKLYSGLTGKRVFYRDSLGTFDELVVVDGVFSGYQACTATMRQELNLLVESESLNSSEA